MSYYADRLEELRGRGLLRRLRRLDSPAGAVVRLEGRELVCFCSNDYLSLANDRRLSEAAARAAHRWGWGAAASRLITGTMGPHLRLEEEIARFKRAEAALVFTSGYLANLAAVRAGAARGDTIFSDALNHASLIDACRLSGAAIRVFAHRDYDHLDRLLGQTPTTGRRLIVTDSLFSMDGDFADLPRLVEIKRRYGADLCVDEAHATGVCGREGRGVGEMMGVEEAVDITVGTLSKALGGLGGFVCGSRELIDYLINTARSLIYTTGMPPSVCEAAVEAIGIVRDEPWRRARVGELAERLRRGLIRAGLNIGDSASHIVPVLVGEAEAAMELAGALLARGLLVWPIRPPSVPEGTARLRISVTAGHTADQIDALIDALRESAGRDPSR